MNVLSAATSCLYLVWLFSVISSFLPSCHKACGNVSSSSTFFRGLATWCWMFQVCQERLTSRHRLMHVSRSSEKLGDFRAETLTAYSTVVLFRFLLTESGCRGHIPRYASSRTGKLLSESASPRTTSASASNARKAMNVLYKPISEEETITLLSAQFIM